MFLSNRKRNNNPSPPKDSPLRVAMRDTSLASEIEKRTGSSMQHCLSCLTCSGGCPFYTHMDFGPHGIMRRIVYGLREEILTSNTIWLCVGCHTCSTGCPMGIDIAGVMDVLRQMALESGVAPDRPEILEFHREVLDSIKRHGRTHKLEIMLRYKMKKKDWFQDINLGFKMLAKRKLDLMPSEIADPQELARLFNGSKE